MQIVDIQISIQRLHSGCLLDTLPYSKTMLFKGHLGRDKRICVFEHSVMTNFNCACPAIQRGQGSSFLSEGSS